MLVTAASGLERLMVGNKNNVNLKDSNVAQISAFLYYQANVIAKLENNVAFQQKFRSVIYKQIEKDFGLYIDSQARIKPKSLHHVYEWRKTGDQTARLFNLSMIGSKGLSFQIDYEFLPSKSLAPYTKFSKKRYKFVNKAHVMENGIPVVIRPRSSKRLVFNTKGYVVFMPIGASVTVKSPGGRAATHQFKLAYSKFFSGPLVSESIKKSGFQKIFNSGMIKALKLPSDIKKVKYSFSPNAIRSQADAALVASFGGAL